MRAPTLLLPLLLLSALPASAFRLQGSASPAQVITGVALSNSTFAATSGTGTTIGSLTTTITPPSPAFSGSVALDTTCGVNCADSAKFALSGAGCANGGACTLQIAVGAPSNPTFVKGGAAASTAVTLAGGIPTASAVLGQIQWDTSGGGLGAITDNAGNTYTKSATVTDVAQVQAAACFSNPAIAGSPTTITAAGPTNSPAILANVYTGAATTLDVAPVAGPVRTPAAGAAINATAITTTQTNDVVWSAYAETTQGTTTMSARAPATLRSSLASIALSEDQAAASPSSVTAAATATGAGASFIPCVAAMKQGASGQLAAGTYKVTVVATQAGASGSPFSQALTLTAADGPTAVTLTPSAVTVSDTCTTGACTTPLSAVSVAMSSGSFTGTLTATGSEVCAISGSNVVVARTLSVADDGVNDCMITATQSGVSAQATLSVTVQPQVISSIALSGSSYTQGAPSGTLIGALTPVLAPAQPVFTGTLSLSTIAPACTAINGAANGSFAISGANLQSAVTLSAATYAVCVRATQPGAGAAGQPFALASSSTCPLGTGDANDGCVAASLGPPQNPTLLTANFAPHTHPYCAGRAGGAAGVVVNQSTGASTATACPPWNVAGVDYRVGVPQGTVLKDPRSQLPACATYSSGSGVVTINSPNCTLDGFNFCNPPATTPPVSPPPTTGLLGISVNANAANFTIKNSYFCRVNRTQGGNDIQASSGGSILNNEFDGMSYTGDGPGAGNPGDDSDMVGVFNLVPGGLVIQYNYCHNRDYECIFLGSNGSNPYSVGNSITIRYNLMENFGSNYHQAHAENTKFCGTGTWNNINQSYNTLYMDWTTVQRVLAGNSGFQPLTAQMSNQDLGCGSGIIETGHIVNNNIILNQGTSTSGTGNGGASVNVYYGGNAAGGRNNAFSNNYLDSSGAGSPYYQGWPNGQFAGGSGTSNTWFSSLTGNINLNTGNGCQPGSYTNNSGSVISGNCN